MCLQWFNYDDLPLPRKLSKNLNYIQFDKSDLIFEFCMVIDTMKHDKPLFRIIYTWFIIQQPRFMLSSIARVI